MLKNNLNCTWNIYAPEGHFIRVAIGSYQLGSCCGPRCSCDQLILYDGLVEGNIAKMYGRNLEEQVFYSTGNQLTVHFLTGYSTPDSGFSLMYRVVNAASTRASTPTSTASSTPTSAPSSTASSAPSSTASSTASSTPSSTPYLGCSERRRLRAITYNQTLRSPNYPEHYPNGVECVWEIFTDVGFEIEVTVLNYNIEQCSESSCDCDRLTITDVNTETDMAVLCGENDSRNTYYSRGNRVEVRLTTDSSRTRSGFQLSFRKVYRQTSTPSFTPYPGCENLVYLNTESWEQTLQSPNYPNHYYNSLNCTWEINSPVDYYIQIQVQSYGIEDCGTLDCKCDKLVIYDSISQSDIATLCGTGSYTETYYSSGDRIRIFFYTDWATTSTGFSLTYRQVTQTPTSTTPSTQCTGVTYLSTAEYDQTLQSPNYPDDYYNNLNCTWEINSPGDYYIQITISSFDIEECGGSSCPCDKLVVYDSMSQSDIASLCGTRSYTETYYSSGDRIRIYFHTDSYTVSSGFSLTYRQVAETPTSTTPSTLCTGVTYLDTEGYDQTLQSPNYPNDYYNNLNCTWEINSPGNYYIQIEIQNYNIEDCGGSSCSCDKLVIYDSMSQSNIISLCGSQSNPKIYYSSGDRIRIYFQTDRSTTYSGFLLKYRQVNTVITSTAYPGCVGKMELSAGSYNQTIQSPNYPNMYYNNLVCKWEITADYGYVIQLNVRHLDLEECNRCHCDRLVLRDTTGLSDRDIASLCGTHNYDQTYYSHGHRVLVEFITDASNTQSGFLLSYSQVYRATVPGCSAIEYLNAYDFQQTLTPYITPIRATNCTWIIQSSGYPIVLRVLDSHLTYSTNCLTIYDGADTRYKNITSLCGLTESRLPIYFSTSDSVMVHLQLDSSVDVKSFQLSYYYTTASIPSCASDVPASHRLVATASTLYLSSPNYPNNYRDNEDVKWLMWKKTDADSQALQLDVVDSDLEYNSNCAYDSVQVYNGPCTSYSRKGKFCGTSEPNYQIPDQDFVLVHFKSDGSDVRKGFQLAYYITDADDDDDGFPFDLQSVFIVSGSVVGFIAIVLIVSAIAASRRKRVSSKSLEVRRKVAGVKNPRKMKPNAQPVCPPPYNVVVQSTPALSPAVTDRHSTLRSRSISTEPLTPPTTENAD